MSLNNKNSNKEVSKCPSRRRPSGKGLKVTHTGHFRGGQAPAAKAPPTQGLFYVTQQLC